MVHLIPSWLVWAEIMLTAETAQMAQTTQTAKIDGDPHITSIVTSDSKKNPVTHLVVYTVGNV